MILYNFLLIFSSHNKPKEWTFLDFSNEGFEFLTGHGSYTTAHKIHFIFDTLAANHLPCVPTFSSQSPHVRLEEEIKTPSVPTSLTLFDQDAIVFKDAKVSTPRSC